MMRRRCRCSCAWRNYLLTSRACTPSLDAGHRGHRRRSLLSGAEPTSIQLVTYSLRPVPWPALTKDSRADRRNRSRRSPTRQLSRRRPPRRRDDHAVAALIADLQQVRRRHRHSRRRRQDWADAGATCQARRTRTSAIVGVARFSEKGLREKLTGWGIECIAADLLDRAQIEASAEAAKRDLHGRTQIRLGRRTRI